MDVTKKITNGNWDERVKSNTKDEFSILTYNINSMLDELEKKENNIVQINKNLKTSEFRWKFAIEGNGDGLWDWEIASNSVYFSPQWKAILGYTDYEIENNFDEWQSRVHSDDIQMALDAIKNYINGKNDSYYVEIRMFHKDGHIVWILAKGVIVKRDENNKPLRIVGTHTDITETKKMRLKLESMNKILEEKVNEQTKELKAMNKNLQEKVDEQIKQLRKNDSLLLEQSKMASMGEMIGNIAHQWRQPLSSISIAASALDFENDNKTLTDKKLKEYIEKIMNQTDYLSQTIDIFRNFLKENKEKEEYILCDEIENSMNLIDASLKSNYIDLYYEDNCDKKKKIFIVKNELSQVVINILNNAKDVLIENNKEQQKWIKVTSYNKDNIFICTIEDNGGGIEESIITRIFEPYFTTKHKSQGTGLGLHMSYQIITESLGGNLHVTNTKDGAKFFLEIPLV